MKLNFKQFEHAGAVDIAAPLQLRLRYPAILIAGHVASRCDGISLFHVQCSEWTHTRWNISGTLEMCRYHSD
jgi:hypothetical protein